MHPAVKRFVEVLTQDVNKWEKAANDVDAMLPHIPETDREHWKETAKGYRGNAAEYKSIIKQYLEDNEPKAKGMMPARLPRP
jgi:hypothetical protein